MAEGIVKSERCLLEVELMLQCSRTVNNGRTDNKEPGANLSFRSQTLAGASQRDSVEKFLM